MRAAQKSFFWSTFWQPNLGDLVALLPSVRVTTNSSPFWQMTSKLPGPRGPDCHKTFKREISGYLVLEFDGVMICTLTRNARHSGFDPRFRLQFPCVKLCNAIFYTKTNFARHIFNTYLTYTNIETNLDYISYQKALN